MSFDDLYPGQQTIQLMAHDYMEKKIRTIRRRVRNIHKASHHEFYVGEFYMFHRRRRCLQSTSAYSRNTWYEISGLSPLVFEEERNHES